ncbi:DNA-binding domain-containing protein [Vibrio sp. 99-8-1]|uniref:HvfC/BufC N-terminal domain-containing protein n=1 Tax=Vibrio sp. 99-8-1 TaxID=2607602 RepID=UPI001493820E|nr:DNA-binding domain-containing protein [Vibrio sp. 99-8-1]NOI68181.1 DUF2063 domain-containing protein [Vibrio sp. 99-8-1]
MTISLSQLQSQFSDALHYQAKGEQCHIVSDHFSADERMQIYRNNFVMSLTDVLMAGYPITAALVGEECFNGLARLHILKHAPKEADVSLYGVDFFKTISDTSAVIDAVPYLADIALFEWKKDYSSHIFGQQFDECHFSSFDQLTSLSQVQQQSILLVANPSLQLFESKFAITAIEQAIITSNFDELDIHQPQQGIVVTSNNGEVKSYTLSINEYRLLQELVKGQSLRQISADLLEHLNALLTLDIFLGFNINSDEEKNNV